MASELIVSYVLRYGGRCRDCADADGICPNTDMPCGFELKTAVIKHTLKALEYGISHGFIADPFTRPAPAATDTGLVTVGYLTGSSFAPLKERGSTLLLRDSPNEWPEKYKGSHALVTGSQAEELLAAERAKYRDAMEKLVESQRETLVWQQRAIDLKADNAAKDARIKVLEERIETENLYRHETAEENDTRSEALEAKLAAAQEALEPFAAHANDRAVDDTGWRDKETVKIVVSIGDLRKARAALGGKPS